MSAVLRDEPAEQGRRHLRDMRVTDLDAVLAIETAAYEFPWTRGNFVDSLHAGYSAWLLSDDPGRLLGYSITMAGVNEMHLLNLTVAPSEQGRGHARWLLDALVAHCRSRAAPMLWLEVRGSNERARGLYRRYGFREIGVRRNYYPAPLGRREDAVVMSLSTEANPSAITPAVIAVDAPAGTSPRDRHGLD